MEPNRYNSSSLLRLCDKCANKDGKVRLSVDTQYTWTDKVLFVCKNGCRYMGDY